MKTLDYIKRNYTSIYRADTPGVWVVGFGAFLVHTLEFENRRDARIARLRISRVIHSILESETSDSNEYVAE